MSTFKHRRTGSVIMSSSGAAVPMIISPRAAGVTITQRGRTARYRGTLARGYTRRAGFYKQFGSGKDTAGELKFFDTPITDAAIATGGTIFPSMNLIPGGSTESTRIGRKCTIREIAWRQKYVLDEKDAVATPTKGDVIRAIVYQDKQCNGAAATGAQILDSVTPTGFYNLENMGRFRILMDKVFPMNPVNMASDGAGLVSTSKVSKFMSFRKKCNVTLEFGGVTGALTEIRSNNIGILLTSSDNNVGLASTVRVRYSDGS